MRVKVLLAVSAALLFCAIAPCQVVTSPAEHVIRRMIDSGTFEGWDSRVIGGMGDAAAVELTKVLAGRKLTSSQIDMALVVLNHSFADAAGIENVPDRQPRTALFALQCFDSLTHDRQLKKRIAETRSYLQKQYAKWAQELSAKRPGRPSKVAA